MMQIHLTTGLVVGARTIPSPNYSERPEGMMIDLLVIHNISLPPGEFGGSYIDAFFTNALDPLLHPYFAEIANMKVSCHCLINREGEVIQYVPFTKRAWHCGESSFAGRANCNDYSIGIELEGTDDLPYTEVQYWKLAELSNLLQEAYPGITRDRIVGHSTVAPHRKTDPGSSFDWNFFRELLDKRRFETQNTQMIG